MEVLKKDFGRQDLPLPSQHLHMTMLHRSCQLIELSLSTCHTLLKTTWDLALTDGLEVSTADKEVYRRSLLRSPKMLNGLTRDPIRRARYLPLTS